MYSAIFKCVDHPIKDCWDRLRTFHGGSAYCTTGQAKATLVSLQRHQSVHSADGAVPHNRSSRMVGVLSCTAHAVYEGIIHYTMYSVRYDATRRCTLDVSRCVHAKRLGHARRFSHAMTTATASLDRQSQIVVLPLFHKSGHFDSFPYIF